MRLVPLLTKVWSPGKAESPITDTRRKPDRKILGRKAPSVLTPPFWPWELTTWTPIKRPNLKVGNFKDDRRINLQ